MKKWKRLFSLVCAFAMIFSLNTTAFAAELPKTDTKQQYEITVGDEAITLEEGEVAYNLLQAVKPLSAMLEH